MILSFATAYPVNVWLIRSGICRLWAAARPYP
ncbi:MAG: DUF4396 domain-containing protein [Actinomycetota bacterium]|nr:DUF4396 domain-containing protein [Actinomycetota bacterium]